MFGFYAYFINQSYKISWAKKRLQVEKKKAKKAWFKSPRRVGPINSSGADHDEGSLADSVKSCLSLLPRKMYIQPGLSEPRNQRVVKRHRLAKGLAVGITDERHSLQTLLCVKHSLH